MIKSFAFVKTKLPGDRGFNAAKCHSFCQHSHCSTFLRDITALYQLLLEGRGGLFLFNVAAGQRGEKLGRSPSGLCVLFISLGGPSKLSKGFSSAAPDGNPNLGGVVLMLAPGSAAKGGMTGLHVPPRTPFS